MVHFYRDKRLLLTILMFFFTFYLFGEEYKVKVLRDTATEEVVYYENLEEHYNATICFSKLYKDARVVIKFTDINCTEEDLVRIEYYQAYFLQRYFHMYGYQVCDRKSFYTSHWLSKGTFHIYFRE